MKNNLLKTESEYLIALERLKVLFDAKVGTPESNEADLIALLVDEYERKHFPFTDKN